MRNIYDIIAEQKAMVDVNIASYDLQYTNEHFMINQDMYYLQEGFKDSIKNIVKKVKEFIKKIIQKIKELYRKVIGFFKKSDDTVEDLEKKIKDAANGVGATGAAAAAAAGAANLAKKEGEKKEKPKKEEPKKEEKKEGPKAPKVDDAKKNIEKYEEPKKEEKKEEPKKEGPKFSDNKDPQNAKSKQKYGKYAGRGSKVDGLKSLLAVSELEVNVIKYGPLGNRELFTGKLGGAFSKALDECLNGNNIHTDPNEFVNVLTKNFSGWSTKNFHGGGYNDDGSGFVKSLRDFLHDETEPKTYKVKDIAETVYSYSKAGRHFLKYVTQMEKSLSDNLNGMLRELDAIEKKDEGEEAAVRIINKAASIANGTFGYIVQSTARAVSTYLGICRRVTTAWIDGNIRSEEIQAKWEKEKKNDEN